MTYSIQNGGSAMEMCSMQKLNGIRSVFTAFANLNNRFIDSSNRNQTECISQRKLYHQGIYLSFINEHICNITQCWKKMLLNKKRKENVTNLYGFHCCAGVHRIVTSNYQWDSNRKVRNKMCLNDLSYTTSPIEYGTLRRYTSKGRSRFDNFARCWTKSPRW